MTVNSIGYFIRRSHQVFSLLADTISYSKETSSILLFLPDSLNKLRNIYSIANITIRKNIGSHTAFSLIFKEFHWSPGERTWFL